MPQCVYPGATTQEFFGALWCLCQLQLRKSSRHLSEALSKVCSSSAIMDGNVVNKLESLPITTRESLIARSFWMLLDWPRNFISASKVANLSRYHFAATWNQQPAWLSEIVETELSKRTMGITTEKVITAKQRLEHDGVAVSKSSLRRALGVRDAVAIDAVVIHRRRANIDEFSLICQEYERQLMSASTARDQRASIHRDYAILLLSALAGQKIEQICALSKVDLTHLLAILNAEADGKSSEFRRFLRRAEDLAQDDELSARAERSAWSDACKQFVGRYGEVLAGHTVRARVARDMRRILPAELWNSADVFRKVFVALR